MWVLEQVSTTHVGSACERSALDPLQEVSSAGSRNPAMWEQIPTSAARHLHHWNTSPILGVLMTRLPTMPVFSLLLFSRH